MFRPLQMLYHIPCNPPKCNRSLNLHDETPNRFREANIILIKYMYHWILMMSNSVVLESMKSILFNPLPEGGITDSWRPKCVQAINSESVSLVICWK